MHAMQASLEEEAAHLRAQVAILKASAEQAAAAAATAATAASTALTAAEKDNHADHGAASVARERGVEVTQLQIALQKARHEKDVLSSSLTDLQRK